MSNHVILFLLHKLNQKELSALCDAYDDGSLDSEIMLDLIEVDAKNYPEKYGGKNLEKSKTVSALGRGGCQRGWPKKKII